MSTIKDSNTSTGTGTRVEGIGVVLAHSPKRPKNGLNSLAHRPKIKSKFIYMQKKLTQRQKDTLKRHASHHTKKHMEQMKKEMKSGIPFTKAHKNAMRKVGK